jgi:FHA domain
MAMEPSHSPEDDLDKTDRLPILEGVVFDQDVEDDAVPMDHTAVLDRAVWERTAALDRTGSLDRTASLPSLPLAAARGVAPDFVRPSGVDLPSLAESVRSVEERIARQNAEFEALTRAYERSRDAELASVARANALAADLASARTALSTHDATMVQVLQSLAERDAQMAALQTEHAKLVPALEISTKTAAGLEAELRTARSQAEALASKVKGGEQGASALAAQLKRSESEVNATRADLATAKKHSSTYLERLRTREWRHGFNQNMFRELDAKVGAAQTTYSALEAERDRLQAQLAEAEARRVKHSTEAEARRAKELAAAEAQRVKESAAAETERLRLTAELKLRDQSLAEVRERASAAEKRIAELVEAADLRQAERANEIAKLRNEQAEQVAQLQSDAETREQEMGVLMAHLQEARRPIQSIEADVKRLTEELAAKSTAARESEEENAKLRASLERTKGALEEREFLIRRLERSESNNANVLGRIQTSIERLGVTPGAPSAAALTPGAAAGVGPVNEWSAELIRIDNGQPVTHVLARRTRIGRAAGCELQIDSSSVSRHHALVLVGPRETIIEDLNSTNGVLINGRKVTRQLLSDGDAITIGDIQFRYIARPVAPGADAGPAEPGPAGAG